MQLLKERYSFRLSQISRPRETLDDDIAVLRAQFDFPSVVVHRFSVIFRSPSLAFVDGMGRALYPDNAFRDAWLADDAARCEPLSASNSLIIRENTGNFRDFARPEAD